MPHQLLVWEALREERKEGDRKKAKKRTMGLEDREEKRRKKNISLASSRQSCWLSILLNFKRILEWVNLIFSILVAYSVVNKKNIKTLPGWLLERRTGGPKTQPLL